MGFSSAEIKEQNPRFGTSLLLANTGTNSAEMPKMINGSFAALFENKDVSNDFARRVSEDLGKTPGNIRNKLQTIFHATNLSRIRRTCDTLCLYIVLLLQDGHAHGF